MFEYPITPIPVRMYPKDFSRFNHSEIAPTIKKNVAGVFMYDFQNQWSVILN
jgi:hypothetical protein